MAYALQLLVNGVTLGMIYGLIAVGYTAVYGIIGMINFAHGDVFMLGAFLSLLFLLGFGALGVTAVPLGLAGALLLAAGAAAAWGFAIERVAYRPLRGSFRLAPLISAIGMSIVLQNFVQVSQGAGPRAVPALLPGGMTLLRQGGFSATLSWMQVAIWMATLAVLAAATLVVGRTRFGRALRACEQDRRMAALLGIDTDRAISATFVAGAALAAIAGMMFLLYYGVIDFFVGFVAGIKAFTAAVLGGIGSLPGAVLGGLLIGLIETFWSGYASVAYKDVAAFGVLILVLIFLPTGLLGRPEVEKV